MYIAGSLIGKLGRTGFDKHQKEQGSNEGWTQAASLEALWQQRMHVNDACDDTCFRPAYTDRHCMQVHNSLQAARTCLTSTCLVAWQNAIVSWSTNVCMPISYLSMSCISNYLLCVKHPVWSRVVMTITKMQVGEPLLQRVKDSLI